MCHVLPWRCNGKGEIEDCEKDGGGEGMIEILRCVICEFIQANHIVPPMIHWLYKAYTLVHS